MRANFFPGIPSLLGTEWDVVELERDGYRSLHDHNPQPREKLVRDQIE